MLVVVLVQAVYLHLKQLLRLLTAGILLELLPEVGLLGCSVDLVEAELVQL